MVALVIIAMVAPGRAQGVPCAPRDALVASLRSNYGEARKALGIAADNRLLELFASEATGSWTITATSPDGLTCMIATGEAFQAVVEVVEPPGEDG
ncbi:hypothetical protein ATO6_15290 [Oceanicola sp. 22II-s10i]|nr:hypothetical protein ATO6_15290 [Oceanicola sp. 22II-s10i]